MPNARKTVRPAAPLGVRHRRVGGDTAAEAEAAPAQAMRPVVVAQHPKLPSSLSGLIAQA